MDYKIAYDFDGVLAEKPKKPEKSWGKMNGKERLERKKYLIDHYSKAEPLIYPKEKFIIITARSQYAREASYRWLMERFGFVPMIFFLDKARSLENVIDFKASILKKNIIEKYYEDNKNVLKGIKKIYPDCEYYFVDENQKIHLY